MVRGRTIAAIRAGTIALVECRARGSDVQPRVDRPVSRSIIARVTLVASVLLSAGATPATAAGAPIVTAGPASSGAVALTFDDGWNRATCARIGRTLRAAGVKGTFFVNGTNLLRAPAKWRRVLDGMPVGNHTVSHPDLVTRRDPVVRRELMRNEAIHERILRRPMLKLFRPPYGSSDARVRSIAARLGYRRTVLWNVETADTYTSATPASIAHRAIGAPRGSIILMHCGRAATALALPAIIRHYRSRGIEMVGLPRLLKG
jgi:peptidoglycan/xylan/chitin deacetylase (PgdA/CDA1 family)